MVFWGQFTAMDFTSAFAQSSPWRLFYELCVSFVRYVQSRMLSGSDLGVSFSRLFFTEMDLPSGVTPEV
jgi:hypothetical protein